MSLTLCLKRFTGFAFGHDNPAPEVWVTRIYFNVDSGVLDVRESIGLVVSTLQSGKGSICRDCYTPLPQAWMSVCDDCRAHRHAGVDADPEDAAA